MLTKWRTKRSPRIRAAIEAAELARERERSTSSGAAAVREQVGMVGFTVGQLVRVAHDCPLCAGPVYVVALVAGSKGEPAAMGLVGYEGCGCPADDARAELVVLADAAGLGVIL